MNSALKCIAAVALLSAGSSLAISQERPQPVDSASAEKNPEQLQPPQKPVTTLAEDRQGETSTKSFEQLDQNQDGKISKEELGADEAQGIAFSKIDRDADGVISRDEWNAYWSGRDDKQ
jgi:EF hand